RFVATLAAHRVTRLVLVPSLLRVLLDGVPDLGSRLPRLRCCIASGEPLPAALVDRFRAAAPAAALVNLYGTTEVGDATWHVASEGSPRPAGVIGRPLPGARVYVLDPHREPVPIGVAGELWVGGPGVADGYLRHPELTAERWVADPFATDS